MEVWRLTSTFSCKPGRHGCQILFVTPPDLITKGPNMLISQFLGLKWYLSYLLDRQSSYFFLLLRAYWFKSDLNFCLSFLILALYLHYYWVFLSLISICCSCDLHQTTGSERNSSWENQTWACFKVFLLFIKHYYLCLRPRNLICRRPFLSELHYFQWRP